MGKGILHLAENSRHLVIVGNNVFEDGMEYDRMTMEYLEQMEREIKSYEVQNKTGNKVLDAVLTIKSMACQGKGIELKCVVEGDLLFFMGKRG